MRIRRIHHLTIAVHDAEAARATFARLFGAVPADGAREIAAFGVRAAEVALGDATLEAVSPLGEDNAVLRFLQRKGEGFYNVALEVDDLDTAVAELAAQGVRVSEPVEARPGLRSAFVAMAATHGLSVELVELTAQPPAAEPPAAAAPTEAMARAPAAAREPEGERALVDLTPDEWSDVD